MVFNINVYICGLTFSHYYVIFEIFMLIVYLCEFSYNIADSIVDSILSKVKYIDINFPN